MSRFTAFLLAVRLFLSHAVLPALVFTGIVYLATLVGGGADLTFSAYMGVLVLLPFTLLAAEEWSNRLEASVIPPVAEPVNVLPVNVLPEPVVIAAEVRLEELAAHRREVYAAGGKIVQSSPIGYGNDRFLVRSQYPVA